MKSILEELWYGNICPNSGCREETKEVNKLMGYIDDHHEALLGMLTNKQKETLVSIAEYQLGRGRTSQACSRRRTEARGQRKEHLLLSAQMINALEIRVFP